MIESFNCRRPERQEDRFLPAKAAVRSRSSKLLLLPRSGHPAWRREMPESGGFRSFAMAVAKGEVAREAVIMRWYLAADTPDNDRPGRRKPGRARRANAKAPCPRRGTRRGSQAERTGTPRRRCNRRSRGSYL